MAIYKTTGNHHNCYFDEFFYDNMDDFLELGKLVLVNLSGNSFNDFVDEDDKDVAKALYDSFSFDGIGSIAYKDWEALEELLGTEEGNELRKVYFDCDDWETTKSVVLLYHNGDFVTIYRD